jgi:hypothetical protein
MAEGTDKTRYEVFPRMEQTIMDQLDEMFPVIAPKLDLDVIRAAAERGYSLRNIARKLGVSKNTIWRFALQHGIRSVYAKRKPDQRTETQDHPPKRSTMADVPTIFGREEAG